jgi:uncharacterized DUF497 family protein
MPGVRHQRYAVESQTKSRYIPHMRFEWDEKKAVANLAKHGVSFEEAVTVFGDPLSDTFDDPDHSADEQRFLIIGASDRGRMLIVAHTDDGAVVRIVSAREPTSGERKSYEESRN